MSGPQMDVRKDHRAVMFAYKHNSVFTFITDTKVNTLYYEVMYKALRFVVELFPASAQRLVELHHRDLLVADGIAQAICASR